MHETKLTDEAERLVVKDRQADYGSPRENHERIAKLWNAYLGPMFDEEGNWMQIEPEDVAMMMLLLKVSRERFKHKRDNIADLIGYALVYNEIRTNTEDAD